MKLQKSYTLEKALGVDLKTNWLGEFQGSQGRAGGRQGGPGDITWPFPWPSSGPLGIPFSWFVLASEHPKSKYLVQDMTNLQRMRQSKARVFPNHLTQTRGA